MAKPNRGDFTDIADRIFALWQERKERRRPLEKQWNEVDRQINMTPDLSFKSIDGNPRKGPDPDSAWMPEVELPLQAQALEVLSADARRMMFPDSGSWYEARAVLTDEYLRRIDFEGIVAGDENQVPTQITQDNANKLVEGWGEHWRAQYPFRDNWDKMNGESFKYGTFAGRGRLVKKRVFFPDLTDGMASMEQEIPMLVPKTIRNVYPEDMKERFSGEGIDLAPGTMDVQYVILKDIERAARKGRKDPSDPRGGWMPGQLKNVEGDKDGRIILLEYEGDLVIPRKTTGNALIRDVTVTIVAGKGKDNNLGSDRRVIRFRTKTKPSYLTHPYLNEKWDSPYGASPLMKGAPIQRAAVNALTQYMAWAQLNVRPPIAYESDEPGFAADGGPVVRPGERWRLTNAKAAQAIQIGEGNPLINSYTLFLQQYADVTGVNAPRLGAQTVSHTTAFAKDAELNRGVIRTVNYVRSVLQNPMVRWLNMEYELGRKGMSGEETFWIPAYKGAVTLTKDKLPEDVSFVVFGAGGPQEEVSKRQNQLQALQLALTLEQMKAQLGQGGEPMDLTNAQREILGKEFADADIFFASGPQELPGQPAGDEQLQGVVEEFPDPGLALLAAGQ